MPGNIPGKRTAYRVTEGIGIRQGMDGAGGSSQGKTIISKCRILDTGKSFSLKTGGGYAIVRVV